MRYDSSLSYLPLKCAKSVDGSWLFLMSCLFVSNAAVTLVPHSFYNGGNEKERHRFLQMKGGISSS